MEIHNLRDKSAEDLNKMLGELREELRDNRFQAANLQLKDVRTIRKNKKQIAKIKTVLKEKQTS